MLKNFKTKLTAVLASVAVIASLVPPLGVFADVPISNANDFFSKLPSVTSDMPCIGSTKNFADVTFSGGVGTMESNKSWMSGYNCEPTTEARQGYFKFYVRGNTTDSQSNMLKLNFGMYNGTEVNSAYTSGTYSYEMDLDIYFEENTTGMYNSDVTGTKTGDNRACFILAGFGSGELLLYQNGYKYSNISCFGKWSF